MEYYSTRLLVDRMIGHKKYDNFRAFAVSPFCLFHITIAFVSMRLKKI